MEDMHIHVRNALEDYNLLKLYANRCMELGIDRVLLLDHGPRLSKKHIARLDTADKILTLKKTLKN